MVQNELTTAAHSFDKDEERKGHAIEEESKEEKKGVHVEELKELKAKVKEELAKICKMGGKKWRKDGDKSYASTDVGEMPRGFLVLRAEVICDLKDEKNYKTVLTLHSVFQGSTDQCDRVRDYIKRSVKAFKGLWRKEVTKKYDSKKQDAKEESKA